MIGSVIGNYEIRGKLGEGGMGAVYHGVDLMLEREVAVKVLRPELANTPQLVERFRTEAIALGRLNHPNIATLYSFLRHHHEFLMIMEFVPGETLETLIRRVGALPAVPAIRLFCQALDGLAHAHAQGIVHRDLKPANLMLAAQGTIKVMDFGIARVLGGGRMTKTGRLIGTLEYMSPEQVRNSETDARSDIYSLGIVLYEMLTGVVPFTSDSEYELMRAHLEAPPASPRVIVPHLPSSLESIILRALAKQPSERFQSASDFQDALNQCLAADFDERSQRAPIVPSRAPTENLAARVPRSLTLDSATANQSRKSVFTPLYVKYNWKHYAIGAWILLMLGGIWGVLAKRQQGLLAESKVTIQLTPTPATPTPMTPTPILAPTSTPTSASIAPALPDLQFPTPQSTPAQTKNPDPFATPTPASKPAATRQAPRRSVAPPPRTVVVVVPSPAPPRPAQQVQPPPPPAQTAEPSNKKKKKEKESKAGDVEKAVKTAREIICVFKRC
jgi:serine/threonine-protein kinase